MGWAFELRRYWAPVGVVLVFGGVVSGFVLGSVGPVPLVLLGLFLLVGVPRGESGRSRRPYDAVPFRGEVDSARGFKLATVGLGPDGRLTFRGLVHGSYGVDEGAVCRSGATHAVPADGCHCGFHAFYSLRRALAHWFWVPDSVLLDVEMFGDMVAHRHGWRAQEQVVMGVFVRPECSECGRRASGVAWRPPARRRDLLEVLRHDRLVPVCSRCCRAEVLGLPEVAGLLGTEVRWAW